jgi:hypothetical protein
MMGGGLEEGCLASGKMVRAASGVCVDRRARRIGNHIQTLVRGCSTGSGQASEDDHLQRRG